MPKTENIFTKIGDFFEEIFDKNQVRIWFCEKVYRDKWPEDNFINLKNKKNVGLAFSGGGIRSATASLGQLRAFHRLGYLNKVKYVGCISGGSWFVIPWMYLPKEISDNNYLGSYTPPKALSLEDMKNEFNSINSFICSKSLETMELINAKNLVKILGNDLNLFNSTQDEKWGDLLGENLLKPLKLFHKGNQRYATYTPDYRDTIIARNDNLNANDFDCIEHDRPYLLVNGTGINWNIMAQLQTLVTKDTALKPKDYPFYPFEFTPVYSGINNSYDKSETAGIFKFGGGYIENLGFDTKEPAGKLDSKFVKVKTNQTYNRLSVQDMMATSGAAPAFHALVVKSMSNVVDLATAVVDIFTAGGSLVATTKIRSLSDVVKSLASIFPKYFYWHIDKNKNVSSQHVHFGDGGFLDNYGLMPLLRRNVKNIVVFINSDVAFKSPAVKSQVKTTDLNSILKTDNTRNGDNLINQITMDGALPCMFGLHQCKSAMKSEPVKWSGQKLKVFEREDFIKTINDFLKCADGTGPIYSNQALRVVENEFLGIKGGYTANVCFISLQSCNDWKEQLTSEIKDKINNDSSLAGFPNFGTFSATTEAKKTLTTAEEINYLLNAQEFNKKQIYLLSNLTDWTTETVFKKAELNKYFETSSR